MNSVAKGKRAEDRAIEHLIARDHHFCKRNIYTRFGEIDLLMYDQQAEQYVFAEVKSGQLAESNLTARKLKRLERSIYITAEKYKISDWRFDLVVVRDGGVIWYQSIT